jgi:hypothetical protein
MPKWVHFLSARKPQDTSSLSGVCLVVDHGVGYCYLRFGEGVVERLGKRMPYGIGPANTAYIKVLRVHGGYDVCCCYTDKSKTVRLWHTPQLPSWVRQVKYKEGETDA